MSNALDICRSCVLFAVPISFNIVAEGAARSSSCCGGSATPQDRFTTHQNGHGDTTGDQNSATLNYKLQSAQHYNHKYKRSFINAHN